MQNKTAAIDHAFSSGNNELGLRLLRQYTDTYTTDIEAMHRLAVIEEQIGDSANAIRAHLKCIKLMPKNFLAYLYAGYWYENQGLADEAVTLYSYAFDLNAHAIHLWQDRKTMQATQLRSKAAHELLLSHFNKLHINSVDSKNNSPKIRNAVWCKTHSQKIEFRTAQRPEFFYIPELVAKPYYDTQSFEWVNELEKALHTIKNEFIEAAGSTQNSKRPYIEDKMLNSDFDNLAKSYNWTAYDLYKNGVINSSNSKLFPKTLTLLKKIPLYVLDDNPFEVFFSLLKPQQYIKPHFGLSNHSLTVHLPIIVPPDCSLRVAQQRKTWLEGKTIIFDDTFEHEAINSSHEDRVVLIFSIWHPGLSKPEQEDIRSAFKARQDWLNSRKTVDDLCADLSKN